MAALIVSDERFRVAALLAWGRVMHLFRTRHPLDGAAMQEALVGYKTASEVQIAAVQEMLKLVTARSSGSLALG